MTVKKFLLSAVFALVLSTMALSVSVFAAEKPGDVNTQENFNFGEVDILINEDLGLIFETRVVAVNGRPVNYDHVETDYSQVFDLLRIPPDQEAEKTFTHNIYDRNNVLMATVESTVKGIYSQIDSWAEIISITPSISGPFSSQFSYIAYKSGADGYLDMYFNGVYAGTFHYRIYTNGTIENI